MKVNKKLHVLATTSTQPRAIRLSAHNCASVHGPTGYRLTLQCDQCARYMAKLQMENFN